MNKTLLNTEIQEFITTHLNSNIHELILKGSPFEGLDIKELIAQIEAKKKCALKLKTWFETLGCITPTNSISNKPLPKLLHGLKVNL